MKRHKNSFTILQTPEKWQSKNLEDDVKRGNEVKSKITVN